MIEIDGSRKSGSGTIVRDAVFYAALTGKEITVYNIRSERKKPGLRAQHLKGIKACADLCQGMLEGAEISSQEICFKPGSSIPGGEYSWDIGTAGSAPMVALGIIIIGLYANNRSIYTVTGGLFQDFAPSIYHVCHVLLPLIKRMGARVFIDILRPGYIPKGNGKIVVRVYPLKIPLVPLNMLACGYPLKINGVALSSKFSDRKVSERMAEAALQILRHRKYNAEIDIMNDSAENPAYTLPSVQPGAAFALWAKTSTGCLIGSDMAGARGRSAEHIGKKTAEHLVNILETDGTVDEYAADQLIPFAALAKGSTGYIVPKITEHIKTRLWLAETFLGVKTKIKNRTVEIAGIGCWKK